MNFFFFFSLGAVVFDPEAFIIFFENYPRYILK